MGAQERDNHDKGCVVKGLFIITRTNEMHKHFESFKCLGNQVRTYTYDHRLDTKWAKGETLEAEIYADAKEYQPDIIVYVGACRSSTPSAKSFAKLRKEVAPTVHFCSDAADEPWWDELKTYDREGSFTVQVAIDGNKNWPLADTQITALTPIDPAHYPDPPKPHAERSIVFGFAGNPGGVGAVKDGKVTGRRPLVSQMIQFGLQHRPRDRTTGNMDDAISSYKQAAAYMADCRITPNFAQTGSFNRMHVKGRVVETGLAGAMLLEPVGSPTPDWFEPGVDYMPYQSMDDARTIVERFKDRPDETQAFGARLRARVLAEHSPAQFWARILDRI